MFLTRHHCVMCDVVSLISGSHVQKSTYIQLNTVQTRRRSVDFSLLCQSASCDFLHAICCFASYLLPRMSCHRSMPTYCVTVRDSIIFQLLLTSLSVTIWRRLQHYLERFEFRRHNNNHVNIEKDILKSFRTVEGGTHIPIHHTS